MSSESIYYSHCSFGLLLLIFTSCNLTTSSPDDLASLTLITSNEFYAGTNAPVQVTLWFNYTIYQYTFNDAPEPNTAYTVHKPTFEVIGSSYCNTPNTKIMIQNDDSDTIYIDKVKFTTTHDIWYGIDSICAEHGINWPLSGEECMNTVNYAHYSVFCVSNNPSCVSNKQILYFDTTQSNQYITHALWMDATNITPQIITCDPTNAPIIQPTHTHSKYPSQSAVIMNTINDDTDNGLNEVINAYKLLIYAVISLLCVSCCCCFILFWYKSTKKQRKDTHNTNNNAPLTLGEMNMVGFEIKSKSISSVSNPKDDDDYKAETNYDPALIHWIQRTLELPEYIDGFMQNGYNTMDKVLQIKRTKQLVDIGITKKGHQTLVMSEIAKLRHSEVKVMNDNDNDSDDNDSDDSDNDVVQINMVNTAVNREDRVHINHHHQVQINISRAPQHEVVIVERGHPVKDTQKNELMMDELIANMKDLPPSMNVHKDTDIIGVDAADVFTVEGDEEEVVINMSQNDNNKGSMDAMLQIIGEDINHLTELGDIVAGH